MSITHIPTSESGRPAPVSALTVRPLRVAVELPGIDSPDYWADLTLGRPHDPPLDLSAESSNVERVRAVDLRETRAKRERIRAEAVESGRDPDSITVLVDLEVVLAPDARTARIRKSGRSSVIRADPPTLSYVGTPHGLAGLIADIHAVRVADGVTLVPSVLPFTVEHLVDETLPRLQERGLIEISPTVTEVLRRFGEGSRL